MRGNSTGAPRPREKRGGPPECRRRNAGGTKGVGAADAKALRMRDSNRAPKYMNTARHPYWRAPYTTCGADLRVSTKLGRLELLLPLMVVVYIHSRKGNVLY